MDISPRRGDHFVRAYGVNLSHRLPLLYTVVLLNIVVLAVTFHSTAPRWLWLYVAAAMFMAIGARTVYWLPARVKRRDIARIDADIRGINQKGSLIGGAFAAYAIALYGYGSPADQSIVHYSVAITCFTAVLSLGQSPKAALGVAVCVMLPATIFFLAQPHLNSITVVLVQVTVTAILVVIAIGYHSDFVSLEQSRQLLMIREREAARMAAENHKLATCDALTGAHNRRAVLTVLNEARAAADDAPPPWLALIDLDGFKQVNDTFGHGAGDAVLRAVTDRIRKVDEVFDFGRIGGDEFALILPGSLASTNVRAALHRLGAAIRDPIAYGDEALCVSCSIGLHRTVREGLVAECLERADAALY